MVFGEKRVEALTTKLQDVFLLNPKVFHDTRGFFLESYSEKKFQELNLHYNFVQDNHSFSLKKGVLRGLHFQKQPYTQAKLVRVIRGAVYDVVVDLRKNSPTFQQWQGFELTAENFLMLLIPRGFAHGFCTLSDSTDFIYKNDNFYMPQAESGIRWNDSTLNIPWPVENPLLSEKDMKLPFLNEISSFF